MEESASMLWARVMRGMSSTANEVTPVEASALHGFGGRPAAA